MEAVYHRRGRWKLGGGGVIHLCGEPTPSAEDGEMNCDRMSGSSVWRGTAKGALHVTTILSQIAVVQEGKKPLTRCDLCGMHMPAGRLIKH